MSVVADHWYREHCRFTQVITAASLLTEELPKSSGIRGVFLLSLRFEWMPKTGEFGEWNKGISESREFINTF